jgi:hypothetical protein
MYVNDAQINPQQSRFSQCLSNGCVPHVLRLTVAAITTEEDLLLFFVVVAKEVVGEEAEEESLLFFRRRAEGDADDETTSSSMDDTGEITVEEEVVDLTLFLRCIIVLINSNYITPWGFICGTLKKM